MIVSMTTAIDGRPVKYVGVVTGEAVLGVKICCGGAIYGSVTKTPARGRFDSSTSDGPRSTRWRND